MIEKEKEKNDLLNELFFIIKIRNYLNNLYKEKNYKYLNECRGFFKDIHILLIDSLVLRVVRLFDPATSGRDGKNQNFSYDRLIKYIEDSNLKEILNSKKNQIKSEINTLKQYRHKCIAHKDLYIKTKEDLGLTSKIIEDHCNELFNVIHCLYNYFDSSKETSRELISNSSVTLLNLISIGSYVWNNKNKDEDAKRVNLKSKGLYRYLCRKGFVIPS